MNNLEMNLENNFLLDEIFEGRIDIAIFVINSNYIFVFDDKENFVIDMHPFYKRYLDSNFITKEQYDYAIKNCRGGALALNKKNIDKYLKSIKIPPKNTFEMNDFFINGYGNCSLSKFYKEPLRFAKDINKLRMKFPKFFLDFDNKYFAHYCEDRFFEKEQPLTWVSVCSNEFLFSIPPQYKYWVIDGMDFSKFL